MNDAISSSVSVSNFLSSLSLKGIEEMVEARRLERSGQLATEATLINPATAKKVRRLLIDKKSSLINETIDYIEKRALLLNH